MKDVAMKGPGGKGEERFSPETQIFVRDEIADCGGNEVFFIGRTDGEGLVVDILPMARGDREAVPAITENTGPGDVVIHNHPTGILAPSKADLSIASKVGGDGVGFYIVDNEVRRVYAVVEPQQARGTVEPLNPEEISALLGPNGPLAAVHPHYESRLSQCRMAADVARILDSRAVGVLEAGTGTGKSLAYLIPAVLWALKGKRRVVVSTRTINLQEQHLRQDLPLVQKALGEPFKAVLIKGRGNYLCLRKRDLLDNDSGELLLDFDDVLEVRELIEWSRMTSDGTLSDLSFVPGDANWNLLKAESDSCLRARCPHFSDCFFYRSRMDAASAQILLVNHHILFADLAVRSAGHEAAAVMPRYDAVVLDEAHNLESVALSYFEGSVGKWGLMGQLGRLVSRKKQDRGLVPFLTRRISGMRFLNVGKRNKLDELAGSITSGVTEARGRMDRIFDDLAGVMIPWLGGARGTGSKWRVPPALRNEAEWKKVEQLLDELGAALSVPLAPLRKLNRVLRGLVDDGFDDLTGFWGDIGAVASRLDASLDFITRVREGEEDGEVCWVDVRLRKGRSSVSFHLTPLDAAQIMEQTLFSLDGPVVMTSATLTVEGTFDFLNEKLGIRSLQDRDVVEEVYPSPFDMAAQMRLAVLDDVAEPGREGYVRELTHAVLDLVKASGGGALVLFTSYRTMDAVFEGCGEEFSRRGIQALRQGESPRTVLLDRFRSDPDLTLFATDSFWEGIDVVGDSLRSVIITRLPFPVPTDPVMEARSEALVREGRDPFMEDSVPRAVIRLRQGVGRLIRHKDDRGFAVICDTRLLKRSYGRIFLNSFPGTEAEGGTVAGTAADIRTFLDI
ncbi:MAG: helicase [Deltaproteobacteria bacterium]|nr:helicase [Deltaproteobacteria bacterium]